MAYTHVINFHKQVKGLGWMHCSFPTTEDALSIHMKALYKQQVSGTVRNLDVVKLNSHGKVR